MKWSTFETTEMKSGGSLLTESSDLRPHGWIEID